jgi:hypothetical protein
MAVERLACDSELGAQFTDLGAGLAYCGLRQPQSIDDQRVLELGQRGENAKYETAVCRRRIELRALARQDPQADPAPGQIMNEIDQMVQVAAEPVEFPHDQRIALPQRLETRLQTRPIVALTGRLILIEVPGFDVGRQQRVTLQVSTPGEF